MKKKNLTVGTIPKSNRNCGNRGKMYAPNTRIYDHSFSWLGAGTSINSDGFKPLY